MFQAINLTKSYKQKLVLSGLSFEVERGEVFCLLGGRGAGKSTTIDLFLNLTRPTSGSCTIGGFNVASQPMKPKSLIAYVPPALPLYEQLTGLENLQYFAVIAGFEELPDEETKRLFRDLGIDENLANARAATYSVEERQRFGLAIAVARDAKALLLDEPTTQMSGESAESYATLVRAYAAGDITGEPAAVLMTTGSAELAAGFADKVGLLRKGKLLEVLEASEIGPGEMTERCAEHCAE